MKPAAKRWAAPLAGVALGTLAFGASHVWYGSPTADSSRGESVVVSQSDDSSAELQSLRNELRRVRARLGRLEQAPQAPVTTTPVVDALDEPPEPKRTPAEQAAHELAQVEQEVQRLHDVVDTSSRDARWAQGYEARIVDTLAQEVFVGSDVTEVVCADALCRVQVVHDSAEAMEIFEREIPDRAPENQGGFYRHGIDAQGSPSSVLFLAPKGSLALLTSLDDT